MRLLLVTILVIVNYWVLILSCSFMGSRDLAELAMGFNPGPQPIMSREEFEAHKAEVKRKREMKRREEM